MSTGALIGIIIAIIVVVAVATVGAQQMRRARLRRQFGSEYDRLVTELGSTRKAEAELVTRQRRAAKLDIRPLSTELQTRFTREWTSAQEQFVDTPGESVKNANALVDRVMRERGYPVDDRNEMVAALSVHNTRSLDAYRRGQDIGDRSDSASTEELREAMLRYRDLFDDLVGTARSRAPLASIRGGKPAEVKR
jgi:hypothetical protein